jgi:hypothetical protein
LLAPPVAVRARPLLRVRRPVQARLLVLARPLVRLLVRARPLVRVRPPAPALAEPMLSRPRPQRRMPPLVRAEHVLRTPASPTDTVCLRLIPEEERRLFQQWCRSVSW